MKKYKGTCPRCGDTTVGVKIVGFAGGRKRGKGFHPEKKGTTKCLSCQSVIGVQRKND